MPEAVIVAAARSPIGRAFKGSLKDVRSDDLAAQMVAKVLEQVPQQGPDAARLHAAVGLLAYHLTDFDAAQEHSRLALELAERHDDRRSAAAGRTGPGDDGRPDTADLGRPQWTRPPGGRRRRLLGR